MKKHIKPTFSLIICVLTIFIVHYTYADWTSFRGNPQLTGVANAQLPEKLELLWTFKAGDMIESTAAIVDNVVYLAALDGVLYAIDAQNGKSMWTYNTESSIKSSPSYQNGVIYFGDGDGIFHAVDIATRKMKWQFTTEGEIISSANFLDDKVLFGSYDGFLYCLNSNSGDLIWKYETEGYVHGTPAVWSQPDDGTNSEQNYAIVTGCDSYLRVINIHDGTQTQQVDLGAYVGASPAISNLTNFNVAADTPAAVGNNSWRAFCGTYGNEVLGIDLTSGDITWQYENPDRQLPFFSSAAITKNIVVIGGRDKVVHALSPDKGEKIWTFTAKSRIESSPVIVGNRVFFGTTRGVFISLDITNGKKVWEFETASSIVASPSVADGKIYIGTEDGILYCFGEK